MSDRSAQAAIADELLDYNERGLGSDHWGSCDADFVAEMALAALRAEGWRVVKLEPSETWSRMALERPFRIVEEA